MGEFIPLERDEINDEPEGGLKWAIWIEHVKRTALHYLDIVDKLPKTADGVPVVPHIDNVFRQIHANEGWPAMCDYWSLIDKQWYVAPSWHTSLKSLVISCYSTRADAEAAKKSK